MRLRWLTFLVVLLLAVQDSAPVAITSPAAGELLRGQVTIIGSMDVSGFAFAQLDFAYASASQPADTWFRIQTFSQPVTDDALAVWDTTSITDGDYVLRLRVNLEDGSFQEAAVPVQLGNDALATPTPEPTSTPEPDSVTVLIPTAFLLAASPTPTDLPPPTPTPLPSNPAALEQGEIYASLGRGALVILGLFALAGLIIRVRRY
jgi:hypothetical protein